MRRTIKEKLRGTVPARVNGYKDKEYEEYLKHIDPQREEVRLALASSPDPRFRAFLERMSDPTQPGTKLQTIAKSCNIPLDEFMEWFSRASNQRAIAIVQTHSPAIVQDTLEDARSKFVACHRCDGLTWIAAVKDLPPETPGYRPMGEGWIRDCPVCRAKGFVRTPGDDSSRSKSLEMAGLINKKGAGIAIIQNFGGQALPSAIRRLDAITVDVDHDS